MAIKSVEEYLDSLRDEREVWFDGERVDDVTTHKSLRTAVEMGALDFHLANDPKYKDLIQEKDHNGIPYNFVFKPMETPEDLMRKRKIVQLTSRSCFGMPGGTKFTGIDGLNSITAASRRIDRELGTSYAERVETFRRHLIDTDAAVAVAVTDTKGDRSLRPSKQKTHPDHYVRVVEERDDGIVVRGAKAHISFAPIVNEIIVIPTRAMKEDDKDYAVAFTVRPEAEGVKMIMAQPEAHDDGDALNSPLAAHIYTAEAILVFDDVFIPKERVFLCREWQYAGLFTYMFSNYHRVSADAYKYTENEILVGTAALMAEYNGIDRASHVQDKLAWLAWYTETTEALGLASCMACSKDEETGLVIPNTVYSNAAKYFFAENFHEAIKILHDIGGGIVSTIPSGNDLLHPEIGPYVEKYLTGKEGVPAEYRFRVIKLIKDLSSYFMQNLTLHAEGSLAAQKMDILRNSDWPRYKAAAKRVAGIHDGEEHPIYGDLPDFPTWTWRVRNREREDKESYGAQRAATNLV